MHREYFLIFTVHNLKSIFRGRMWKQVFHSSYLTLTVRCMHILFHPCHCHSRPLPHPISIPTRLLLPLVPNKITLFQPYKTCKHSISPNKQIKQINVSNRFKRENHKRTMTKSIIETKQLSWEKRLIKATRQRNECGKREGDVHSRMTTSGVERRTKKPQTSIHPSPLPFTQTPQPPNPHPHGISNASTRKLSSSSHHDTRTKTRTRHTGERKKGSWQDNASSTSIISSTNTSSYQVPQSHQKKK